MAWRVVSIEGKSSLSLNKNRIKINQEAGEFLLPLEDVDSIVLAGGSRVTTNLLTEFSRKNILAILLDNAFLPCGFLAPLSQHSRAAKTSRSQIAMSEPLRKKIWQRIIFTKITNQADVVKFYGFDDKKIRENLAKIRSGDSTNRESVAAREYFRILLDDTTRRKPLWYNSALNYGYAIVRSRIAQALAARGFILSQGIFHRNELNAYNLADDIIESFRPAVDYFILLELAQFHVNMNDATLSTNERHKIIDILNEKVRIKRKSFAIKNAIDLTVDGLLKSILENDVKFLEFPEIIKRSRERNV